MGMLLDKKHLLILERSLQESHRIAIIQNFGSFQFFFKIANFNANLSEVRDIWYQNDFL